MSRLKLFLLLLIVATLSTVFIQNRELLALKLLCADNTQSCFYQTPQLPLALWIGLFTLGGIFTSLLGQVFSRYSYSGSLRPSKRDGRPEPEQQNWVDQSKESGFDQYSGRSDSREVLSEQDSLSKPNSYESPQEPQSVERSGSNYSYRYRPADKSQNNANSKSKKNSIDLEKEAPDQDNEDWI